MRTLPLLLLMAALPRFAANTTLYGNTANTGSHSGHTCLTNEMDHSADSACTSLYAAESKLPADITTGGDQGVWTIPCEGSVAGTTAIAFSGFAPSVRHSGIYTTETYRLEAANSTPLTIADHYVRVTGLQMYRTATTSDLIATLQLHDQTGAADFEQCPQACKTLL